MWILSKAPGIKFRNQNLPPLNKASDHYWYVLLICGSWYFELCIIKVKDTDKTNISQ